MPGDREFDPLLAGAHFAAAALRGGFPGRDRRGGAIGRALGPRGAPAGLIGFSLELVELLLERFEHLRLRLELTGLPFQEKPLLFEGFLKPPETVGV